VYYKVLEASIYEGGGKHWFDECTRKLRITNVRGGKHSFDECTRKLRMTNVDGFIVRDVYVLKWRQPLPTTVPSTINTNRVFEIQDRLWGIPNHQSLVSDQASIPPFLLRHMSLVWTLEYQSEEVVYQMSGFGIV